MAVWVGDGCRLNWFGEDIGTSLKLSGREPLRDRSEEAGEMGGVEEVLGKGKYPPCDRLLEEDGDW